MPMPLEARVLGQFEKRLGMPFEPDHREGNLCFVGNDEVRPDYRNSFAQAHLLDYILAILHAPTVPKPDHGPIKAGSIPIPFPKDSTIFWKLVKLGGELRRLQSTAGSITSLEAVPFPFAGTDRVDDPRYADPRVYINDTQYFDQIPPALWSLSPGGHRPLQEWLELRRGQLLSPRDIREYQRLIGRLIGVLPLVEKIKKIGR